jgi:hypothetical protein
MSHGTEVCSAEPQSSARRVVRYPRPMGRRKQIAIAVAVVVVMVAAGLASTMKVGWGPFAVNQPSGHGPAVTVEATAMGPTGTFAAVGANVTIFSEMPSALESSALSTNLAASNGENVVLYSGTTGSGGLASGYLAAGYSAVLSQWRDVASPLTVNVSLLVEAMYLQTNGSRTYLYQYFNYLPYNPRSPPIAFSFPVSFNLAHPVTSYATSSLEATNSLPAGVEPTVRCPNNYWTWETNFDHTYDGPFPLATANDTYRGGDPYLIAFGDDWTETSVTLDFTGASGNSNNTISVQGSNPSWTGSGVAVNGTSANAGATASSNGAFAMIFINNSQVNVLRQTWGEKVYYYNGLKGCQTTFEDTTQFITYSLEQVTGTEFYFATMAGSQNWGYIMSKVFGSSSVEESGVAVASGHTYQFTGFLDQAQGYSNAQSVESQANSNAGVFISSLAVAVSVMIAVSDACWVACSAGDAAGAVSVILSVAGFASSLLTDMQSISFQTSTQESIDTVSFTAQDIGFNFNYIEGTYETDIEVSGGGNAFVYMPLPYVVGIAE